MWAGNQRGDFNPLPRKEGDEMGSKTKFSASISIRSLVKRETTGYRWLGDETKDFNPLPRKEGDMELKQMYQMHGNFNPLPRKEGDYNIDDVNETYSISIRSLVKRETIPIQYTLGTLSISIRSLVKRETANFAKIWLNRILILCTFLLEHKKF